MTCTVPVSEACLFADVLDCLDAALLLIRETGHIVHANASGLAMLDRRSVLRVSAGRLVGCQDSIAHVLRAIFAKAPVRAGWTALPLRATDGEHCIAHVLPLASGARSRAGVRYPPIAAVLVHKVATELPAPSEAIAALYGLTPGEARVLHAIVEVGGVRETARALRIGEATVKTHLHHLFGKTGATRQADLVKLVAGFANPIVGRPRPLHRRQPTRETTRSLSSLVTSAMSLAIAK